MADKVQIDIVTTADTSGASKAEAAIKNVGAAAKDSSSELEKLRADAAAINAQSIGSIPPPLPEAGGSNLPPSVAGLASPAGAAAAAALAISALNAAYQELAANINKGALDAAKLADELRTLPSDKAQELRDRLGPVADLLDANSVALAEYAKHSADAELESQKFWISMSTRAVPALNELREAAKGPETNDLANRLGTDLAGGAHLAAQGIIGLDGLLQKVNTSATTAGEGITRYLFPGLSGLETLLNAAGQAWEDYDSKSQSAAKAAQEQERILSAGRVTEEAIAKARAEALESQLPLEEKLAAVRARQAELLFSANGGDDKSRAGAAALEKEAVGLESQIKKQNESAAAKRKAQEEANADIGLRLQLQEATNAGDQKNIDLLKQQIAYRSTLKSSGGNEGLAERAASAEADAQQKRRADADAKELEARQKYTESLTFGAKEKSDNQQEMLAKKRDELELETAINEAKAIGNDAEVAKLQWIKQYNALLGQGFTDDEARRAANAASAARAAGPDAAGPSNYVKPGELAPGGNFRRGRTQSDLSYAMSQADQTGGSLLDAYNANRSTPVGSIGGNDPTKSSGTDKLSASGKSLESAGDKMDGAAGKVASAIDSLAGNISGLSAKVDSTTQKLEAVAAKVQALIDKV